MKSLLLIIGIASIALACSKKEEVKPIQDPQTQNAPQAQDQYSEMVKVTTWSNRIGYTYRRKPYRKDWTETVVKTKTAVFYEEYCHCKDEGILSTEYAMFASHKTSFQKNDSITITIEYKGRKATNLNERGMSFAITHLIDMK